VEFGVSRCVTDAVLCVVAQQHLDYISVRVKRRHDAQVERSQAVVIYAVYRRTQIQQSLTTSHDADDIVLLAPSVSAL